MEETKRLSALFLASLLMGGLIMAVFFMRSLKTSESSVIYLELNFEEVDDQQALSLLPITENQSNLEPDVNFLMDGALRLGGKSDLGAVSFKHDASPGRITHVRMRMAEEGPCSYFELFSPHGKTDFSIRLSGCPRDDMQTLAMISWNNGKTVEVNLKSYGGLELNPNEWFDLVFWLHPDGDKIIYVGGYETNPEQFLYGAISLPPDWQSYRWGISLGGFFGGIDAENLAACYTDVDFARLSDGDLLNYLDDYFPVYQNHQDVLNEFLNSDFSLLETINIASALHRIKYQRE